MATETKGRPGGRTSGTGNGTGGGRNGTGGSAAGGGGGRASRVVRCTVITGVLLAVLAGCGGITAGILSSEGYLPGDSLRETWETPHDRVYAEYGNGAWHTGDTVVRSRYDAVTGFDARSGEKRWEYVPPGRSSICGVSRTAENAVALVAHGEESGELGAEREGKGCATVTALDLTSGRELWHTARTPADGEIEAEPDVVAAGGGLAVLRDDDTAWRYPVEGLPSLDGDRALRAFDLRTGAPRWKADLPGDCVPHRVAAAARQVLAVLLCGEELKLAAFGTADGKERWTVPLDPRRAFGADDTSSFLSADPVVVNVGSYDSTAYRAYLAFGEDGTPQGRIESGGPNGTLATGDDPAQIRIAYGRLYAVTEHSYDDVVSAFDLRTGQRLWRVDAGSPDDVIGLSVRAGRVTAVIDLYGSSGEDGLYVLDADTGDIRDERTFPDSVAGASGDLRELFEHEGRLIVARWGEGLRPFTAYEER